MHSHEVDTTATKCGLAHAPKAASWGWSQQGGGRNGYAPVGRRCFQGPWYLPLWGGSEQHAVGIESDRRITHVGGA